MKISMSPKKTMKIKSPKVKKNKEPKVKNLKSVNCKNIKTNDKRKLFLGLGIGGGVLILAGIIVLLIILLNPPLIVSGRVFEDSTKTNGLYNCKIYKGMDLLTQTDSTGKFSLEGLEIGDEISFVHDEYNLNDFSQYNYVVIGRAYLEIIGSRKLSNEEIDAQEGITINFYDNNNNLITNGITAKDINENVIATTSTGKMFIKIEANITVYFTSYYYTFNSMNLTLSDKNTKVNYTGEFITTAKDYLTCKYILTFENGNAFVNSAATVIYTFKNNLTSNSVLSTINSDTTTGQYFIQFTADNKVMFNTMSIFIKDETNQRYWFASNVSPSATSGTINIVVKNGFLIKGTYLPNRKIYLENGGIINCDSTGNFWFVANGTAPKFYTNQAKSTQIKLYADNTLVETINSNLLNIILR